MWSVVDLAVYLVASKVVLMVVHLVVPMAVTMADY